MPNTKMKPHNHPRKNIASPPPKNLSPVTASAQNAVVALQEKSTEIA